MKCNYCGGFIQEDDQFCGTCGMAVGQPPVPEEPPKKKKHLGLILTVVVASLLLVAGGFGAWWLLWGPGARVTVYVMTEYRQYNEDGVNVSHVQFQYNDRGLVTAWKEDCGTYEWDEESRYWEYVSEEVDGTFETIKEMAYDQAGMPLDEYSEYRQWGDYSRNISYEYDYDSDKLLEKIIQSISTGDQKWEHTYSLDYDSEGRVAEVRSKEEGESAERYLEVEYDSEGRLETYVNYAQKYKIRYRYDEDGRLTERKYYGKEEESSGWVHAFTIEYSYNDKGRLKRVEAESLEDDDSITCECKYDSKNNLTTVVVHFNGEKALQVKYSYDGRKINGGEITIYEGDDVTDTQLTYDDNGNLVELENGDGSYVLISYKKLRLSREDARRYYNENAWVTALRSGFSSMPAEGFYGLIALPDEPVYALLPFNRD